MDKITHETRRESYIIVKQFVGNRQLQCLNALKELEEATANELAMHMFEKGTLPYFSRNFVQPRLNELVARKAVKIVGKKFDRITQRTCVVYRRNIEEN